MTYHATPGTIEQWEIDEVCAEMLSIMQYPVALWPLFERSGTSIEDVGREGRTLTATADVSSWNISTGRGTSLDFDATYKCTRADAGHDFNFGNGVSDTPFSVFALINHDGHTGSRQGMLGKANMNATPGLSAKEWDFGFTPSETCWFMLYTESAGGFSGKTLTNYPASSTWLFMTGTYDGSGTSAGVNVYIDGEIPAQFGVDIDYVAMEETGVDMGVGGYYFPNAYLNGKMMFAGVCAKELSKGEIQALTVLTKGLVGV